MFSKIRVAVLKNYWNNIALRFVLKHSWTNMEVVLYNGEIDEIAKNLMYLQIFSIPFEMKSSNKNVYKFTFKIVYIWI